MFEEESGSREVERSIDGDLYERLMGEAETLGKVTCSEENGVYLASISNVINGMRKKKTEKSRDINYALETVIKSWKREFWWTLQKTT